MPKRPNPWSDSTPMQLKTHIGPKEIARGVNGPQYMKIVYEKTKHLLLEGARREIHSCSSAMDFGDCVSSGEVFDIPIPAGQATLDINGCIAGKFEKKEVSNTNVMNIDVDSDCSANESPSSSQSTLNLYGFSKTAPAVTSTPHPSPAKGCQCCGKNSAVPVLRCHFCSRKICVLCNRACSSCHHGFCSLCSAVNYEPVELAFCLNCISFTE